MLDPGLRIGETGAGRQRHPESVVEALHDEVGLAVAVEVGVLRLAGLEGAAMLDPGLRIGETGAGRRRCRDVGRREKERVDRRGNRIAVVVRELEACGPGCPGKVALKGGVGKLGMGAVIGIRGAEDAVEGILDAFQIEEIAEIGVEDGSRGGIAFRRQHGVAGGGEIVGGLQQVLRQSIAHRVVTIVKKPDRAVGQDRQRRLRRPGR